MSVEGQSPGNERENLLAACFICQVLDEDARRELSSFAYRRSFEAGEQIFERGSPGQSMMTIVAGEVRISVPRTGNRSFVLAELGAGQVFGEIALLDGGERTADVTAVTRCEVLVLERRDVLALLERHPAAAIKLLSLLCTRLRQSDERMAELAFLDVPSRLARAILRAAGEGSRRPARLAASQTELANMVGSSRENVNRCLKSWQKRGLVDFKDGWLVVTDRDGLHQVGGAD